MSTDREPEISEQRTGFAGAFLAGQRAVFKTPRWQFVCWVLAGVVVGNVVRAVLVSKYAMTGSQASFFATIAVILTGLIAVLALAVGPRAKTRRASASRSK